uniref:Uncharacterized protein n=1 Tax=viral metagenome TaxID=1070528 RepID=A0A6C0BS60_9ZZZZ
MEQDSDDLFNNMMKIYLSQMDSAMKISKIICEHSDREELSGNDIICGLIYRLMIPMESKELNESLSNAEKLLEYNSDDEIEDYDDIPETYERPIISQKLKSNNCNCETCIQMRVCLLNYHSFETTDQLAEIYRNSIKTTCDKYNISI